MDDSGVFDIAAAEAALNNISSASNTSTDIDVSTDVEISEDSKEDTAGGIISITIPPELLGEIPEGSDLSGSDRTMTDLPSEDNSVVPSEVPAEDYREKEEDVTAEADGSASYGVLDEAAA
ncbi:MAG: hypothetical protein IIZ39_01385, partial [Blautia sp.]|nr:hypothetical protein [Blautia sp.]